MRSLRFIEHIQQDLRFGFRMLVRSPSYSLLAIFCLTVGIGANTAVFSWIEGALFRPYPRVAHQERLFVLAGTERGTQGFDGVSWPDFLDFQKNCKLVDAVVAEKIVGTTLSIGDRAERATGSIVSANYFDAMGIRPVLGRGFARDEDTGRNAHPVVVISYRLWQDRFLGDPAIVGKTQMFNGLPHTIVGVAPEGFYGTFVGYPFQFWVPASMQERFDSTGIPAGGPQRKMDRRLREAQARRESCPSPGGDRRSRTPLRGCLSGNEPRPRHQADATVAVAI